MAMIASNRVIRHYQGQDWAVLGRDCTRILSVHETEDQATAAAEMKGRSVHVVPLQAATRKRLMEARCTLEDSEAHTAEAQNALAEQPQAGDILTSSWGYEQTNVCFYEVTRSTPHTVWLRPIASRRVDGYGDYIEQVVPDAGHFIGEEFRRKYHRHGEDSVAVSINSIEVATTWTGKALTATHYA